MYILIKLLYTPISYHYDDIIINVLLTWHCVDVAAVMIWHLVLTWHLALMWHLLVW